MALVILIGIGTPGETLPYVAVGAELRRRGHEVALVSSPAFERHASEAGLTLVPVGTLDEYREFMQDPELWDRDTVVRASAKYSLRHGQGVYEAILGVHRPGETVLFAGPKNHAARMAREKLRIPFAAGVVSPSRIVSRFDPRHPSRPFPAWTNPLVRSKLGLRLLWRLRTVVRAREPLPASARASLDELGRLRRLAGLPERPAASDAAGTELVICLWPTWFTPPQRDWPRGARTSGFPFYPELPKRKAPVAPPGDRSRPIVFTRGSTAGHQRSFYSVAVECSRILGRPAALVTPHVDDVPSDLPQGVEHIAFAPFGELFGTAAAIVHHGGIGTIAHALAAGVPQLVLPMVGEQFDLGYRVERLGAGRMLTRTPLTAAHLAGALESMLTSERMRSRCQRLRREVDPAAGCSLAADWIEEQATSGRGQTPA